MIAMTLAARPASRGVACRGFRTMLCRPLNHVACETVKSTTRNVECAAVAGSSAPVTHVEEVNANVKSSLPNWLKSCLMFLGAAVLGLVLMLGMPATAEAARSGGRAGGSSFSSFSRSSGPSYSSPSSSSSRSPMGMGGGMGYRSPTVVVAPSYGFGYPMFYGGGMMGGGSSLFTLLVLGIFGYVLLQTITGSFSRDDDEDEEFSEDSAPMSVVKLQVGLLGSARQLQRDLNRMANSTDTSTPAGLHYLLQETVLALRRNPQYAVYGKAMLTKTRGLDNAEAKFNEVSMEERGKFESETLSNFGGRTSRSVARAGGDGLSELIVVTIIAAVDGKVEPVDVKSVDDLKTDLNLLGSIPSSRLLALEVLWTPQDDNDYFTKDELIEDYPLMNTI